MATSGVRLAVLAAGMVALGACGGSKSRPPGDPGSGGRGGAAAPGGSTGGGGSVGAPGGTGGGAGTPVGGASGTPGTSGGAGSGATGGGAGAGGRPPTMGDNGTTVLPPPLDKPATPETAGPLGLRRLTLREYQNTVADLLGMTPNAASTFPPDEISSTGFAAPVAFTPFHTEMIADLSEKLAAAALAAGTIAVPCTQPAAGAAATACAADFIGTFGRRAFRRPVTPAESADLLVVFAAATSTGLDFRSALTYVVSGILQSPNFLYHWEIGDEVVAREASLVVLTPHQMASRLSFFLWETMPDEMLLAAADARQLSTPEQVLAQANRMLADPVRSRRGFANFHEQWLRTQSLEDLVKDPARYPSFNTALRDAAGEELRVFVSSVMSATGDGTLKTLLTDSTSYANSALGALYGVSVTGDLFSKVQLNPAQRAGILTQAAFLAANATSSLTDPIKRGRVVWQRLLCGNTATREHPTDDVLGPAVPMTSNRSQYARQLQGACAECHQWFDPLGFAFENYNAIGVYQTTDNGVTVDASGDMLTPAGAKVPFRDAIGLVKALADSDEVKWCVTRQWFRHLLGRMDTTADLGSMERAYRAAAATPGYSIRDMLTTAVQTKAFRYRALSAGEM
ncbi:MAG: DUF1592 domain-containing protein [Pseudomonadota bacterium]